MNALISRNLTPKKEEIGSPERRAPNHYGSKHYGSKQGDIETLSYTLSHELGSERSERANE